MKYTLEEIKHAARVLKETCEEQARGCAGCPLSYDAGWGYMCVLDTGGYSSSFPGDWDLDKINQK